MARNQVVGLLTSPPPVLGRRRRTGRTRWPSRNLLKRNAGAQASPLNQHLHYRVVFCGCDTNDNPLNTVAVKSIKDVHLDEICIDLIWATQKNSRHFLS